jgi:hypothetical protein
MVLYVVYGPSAEWADGEGIHGVFRRRREAEGYARDLRESDIEMAVEALADDAYVPPFGADERRIRRARRRVRAGLGISWDTAAHALGWPYDGRSYYVVEVGPDDPTYGDLVDWIEAEDEA